MSLQSLLTTPYTGLVYASYSTLYIYPHSLITGRLRLAFPSSSLNSLLFHFQFFSLLPILFLAVTAFPLIGCDHPGRIEIDLLSAIKTGPPLSL